MKLITRLLLATYGTLWEAATPLLRRHKRLKPGFEQRLVPDSWAEHDDPSLFLQNHSPEYAQELPSLHNTRKVWIQAASGGEAWLVETIAKELETLFAEQSIHHKQSLTLFCTTWTEQGFQVLSKLAEQYCSPIVRIIPRYFPLDTPSIMKKAINDLQPDLLVLLETELWPHLLLAAHKHKVPVLVINGRMTEKSLSGYTIIQDLWQYAAPQHVLAISFDDATRFANLFGAENVSVMSSIKFDRAWQSLQHQHNIATPSHQPMLAAQQSHIAVQKMLAVCYPSEQQPPTLLFASVREEEEALLLPHIAQLVTMRHHNTPLAIIIAPRHMHRIAAWQASLQKQGISAILRSQLPTETSAPRNAQENNANAAAAHASTTHSAANYPVILWDAFGELDALYAHADAAFVGGSLAPLGGQNFLEPLGKGLTPLIGPHWKNFHWVGHDLMQQGLVHELGAASDLIPAMMSQLQKTLPAPITQWDASRQVQRQLVTEQFKTWLHLRTGGSLQAALAILNILGYTPQHIDCKQDATP